MSEIEKDINSSSAIKKRIENNPLLGVLDEINSLKDQPRLQIFITHGFLEFIVSVLVKSKTKNGKKIYSDSRSYPYSAQILILNEVSVISDEQFQVLDWFRKMRNKAAHEALFKITEKDLSVIRLNGSKVNLEDFTEFCTNLILILTQGKFDVLGSHIMPTFF